MRRQVGARTEVMPAGSWTRAGMRAGDSEWKWRRGRGGVDVGTGDVDVVGVDVASGRDVGVVDVHVVDVDLADVGGGLEREAKLRSEAGEAGMGYLYHVVERQGAVAVILFNRPPINAVDIETQEETLEVLRAIEADRTVRAVVLSSAVAGYFSAGANLRAFERVSPEAVREALADNRRMIEIVVRSSKPFVASINGTAVGGGFELALFCDIRFAAAGFRMGLPELNIGFIPARGGTQVLSRLIGLAKATELLFEGRLLTAEEALAVGLVHKVLPIDRLLDESCRYAAMLAEKSPRALGLLKRSLRTGLEADLEEGLEIEAEAVMGAIGSQDLREGISAFFQKRAPRFRGD
jgi:enoyl-CoA hydratase/carnithine racemase